MPAQEEAMRVPAPVLAACSLALLLVLPAAAQDLTISIVMKNASLESRRPVTTLFVSSSDVRYRTRYYRDGGQDWLFNVASGRLVVIDHAGAIYFESTPDTREEVRRLEQQAAMQRYTPPQETILVQKQPVRRSVAGYDCEVYEISYAASPGPMAQVRWKAWWLVTGELQTPAYFAFQDAVLEEARYELPGTFGDRRLPFEVPLAPLVQAYGEIKSRGLFPLASTPFSQGSTYADRRPTPSASELLFSSAAWSIAWVRTEPLDGAIFTIVKDADSILSPVLPASYKKVEAPTAQRSAFLRDRPAPGRR
jgi:hypothetical protein